MGKKEQQLANQANKSHKTLRDKLRKKRQQLKKHKKQKSQKHKNYDANQKKKQYFQQTNAKKKKRQDGIKQYKLNKHIEKFVDIYEDDIEDFYQLFETLDQGGKIDITDVANPAMQKCLKKLFKYLPLNKKKLQYQKKQGVQTKLYSLMKQLVSKSIQNYMENGTDNQRDQNQNENQASDKQSSDQNMKNQNEKKSKHKKKSKKQEVVIDKQQQKKKKMQIQNKNIRQYQRLNLYPQKNQPQINNNSQSSIGPCISAEQRQYLAKMFQNQNNRDIQQPGQTINQKQVQQNDQFSKIFSMASQSKRSQVQNQKSKPRANIDDIPQQLLAEGSARIGQKQQIDLNQIQQYDKIHRPRKLIQQYQQMKKLGKYAEGGQDGKKVRKPFDRQRDIVNGRSRQFLNRGIFFDFKERMSKPKSNSNFL